jgi:hypothetical protein
MIHLIRVGDDEQTPSLKCDLCGAELMFHTTLHDDELLAADPLAAGSTVEDGRASPSLHEHLEWTMRREAPGR